jgi:HAE1 family hydrophobic/amphiphilic exporter-1
MILADTSIRRPVTTTMVMLALIVFGIIGYRRLGLDLFPKMDFPIVTVTTVYRGADPRTVEEKVSKKLEDAVTQVSGIKTLRSISLENVSQVILVFELEKDINIAAQEVRDKVSAAMRDLPEDVEPPRVEQVDIGASPIVTIAVSGDAGVSRVAIGRFADKTVQEQLRQINGVGQIELAGFRDRTIWVYADPDAMKRHNVTIQDVVTALKYQNAEVPAGNIPQPGREVAIKTKGYAQSLDDLGRITVMSFMGAEVKLGDVARVVDDFEEERSRSEVNGKPALSVVVRKQSGTNTVEVARKVRDALPRIQALAPAGIRMDVVSDLSTFIRESVDDAMFDLLFGAVLAVVVIALFLRNLRMTFISAVAIPTSVIGAFAFMKAMGFTLNYLSLLALSLSVGLLVDDAIVVLENIFRHVEHGEDRKQAASTATAEIGLAVTATTFSLVAVFAPIATAGGMIGRILKDFGLTVVAAVLISLFVSFTLTPMLSARLIKKPSDNIFTRAVERVLKWVEDVYARTVSFALRHRAWVLLVAFAVFGASVYLTGLMKKEMVPKMDQARFQIIVEAAPGSSLDHTQAVVRDVLATLEGAPGVRYLVTTIGGGVENKVEKALIMVELVDPHERTYRQRDLMVQVRERLAGYPGASIAVEDTPMFSIGGMRASLVQFNIRGPSLERMDELSKRLMERMRKAGGYVDIDTTYRTGKPEIGIVPDRDRAYALGVPIALAGMTARYAVAGDKVTDFRDADEMYDVRVRLTPETRGDLATLQSLAVRNPANQQVELGSVSRVQPGEGPLAIERQAGQRQVTIVANLEGKVLETALEELRAWAKEDVKDPGYVTDFAGEGEFMEENFRELTFALFLAIVMIYFILASQFESFIHPFTIMLSLPLSVVGGVGALLLAGETLSIFGMIGFIMLMGLVTKNAILLVDFAIQGEGRGLATNDAVIQAGRIRLRPILMTTAAMIFGMLPIAFGMSKGSEVRAPMALVVIGGLITSTFLTLVVVPVVYSLIESALHRMGLSASSRE